MTGSESSPPVASLPAAPCPAETLRKRPGKYMIQLERCTGCAFVRGSEVVEAVVEVSGEDNGG